MIMPCHITDERILDPAEQPVASCEDCGCELTDEGECPGSTAQDEPNED